MKEKLQWIFRFYDIDDDGKLTKQVDRIFVIDLFIYFCFFEEIGNDLTISV